MSSRYANQQRFLLPHQQLTCAAPRQAAAAAHSF